MGFSGQKTATKFYFPSEKAMCFQLLSPRTRRRRYLVHQKFRLRTNTTLLRQLTNKQIDLTKGVSRKEMSQLRNVVGSGECQKCWKRIQKFPLFWQKLADRKFRQILSQHTAHLIGVPSNSAKKISISKPPVFTGLINIAFAQKEIWKGFFSAILLPEEFLRPKIWNILDREAIVVFIQQLEKPDW